MEASLKCQSRRELIGEMVPRYQKASVAQKGALLDEIAAATGYARRYAMWLLNHAEEPQQVPRRRRPRTYGVLFSDFGTRRSTGHRGKQVSE